MVADLRLERARILRRSASHDPLRIVDPLAELAFPYGARCRVDLLRRSGLLASRRAREAFCVRLHAGDVPGEGILPLVETAQPLGAVRCRCARKGRDILLDFLLASGKCRRAIAEGTHPGRRFRRTRIIELPGGVAQPVDRLRTLLG